MMADIKTLLLMVIVLMVPLCLAARCSSADERNQCYPLEDFCYSERKNISRCEGRMEYHCCWDPGSKRFREACAESVECTIGTEPWIIEGKNGFTIMCNYCHDYRHYYNPYDSRMSNEYSQCDVPKDECSPLNNKVNCSVLADIELYTKNIRCRCDVRNGYRTDRFYSEIKTACAYDHGLSCVKASCHPSHDILLLGYRCAPKCPPGYSRTSEEIDDCLQISRPDQSQEPSQPPSISNAIRRLATVPIPTSAAITTESPQNLSRMKTVVIPVTVSGCLFCLGLLVLLMIYRLKFCLQNKGYKQPDEAIGQISAIDIKTLQNSLKKPFGKRLSTQLCFSIIEACGYRECHWMQTSEGDEGSASTNKQKSATFVRAEVEEPLIELDSGYFSTGAVDPTSLQEVRAEGRGSPFGDEGSASTNKEKSAIVVRAEVLEPPIDTAPCKQCCSNNWKGDYNLHRIEKRMLQIF